MPPGAAKNKMIILKNSSVKRPSLLLTSDPGEEYPSILVSVSFYTDRLGKFLQTKTDVEISAQPDFEDQTLDFSDVEELMGSINTIPGACLT